MATSKQLSPSPADLAALIKVDFDEAKIVGPIKSKILDQLEGVRGIVIADDDDAKAAAETLVTVAAIKKEAATVSAAWLEGLKAETKRIRTPLLAVEKLCDDVRALVERPLGRYQLDKELAQQAALKAATEAAKADDAPALTQALQAVSSAAPIKLVGTTFKPFWKAEVFAPDLVPHGYLKPDLEKIGKHAANFDPKTEPTPIGGVRFTLETSSTVRQPR